MYYFADLSKPFSPAMIRKFRRDGAIVTYVHPLGATTAIRVASRCGLPDAVAMSDASEGFEPLPQFEKPLPTSWRHMLPGPARDAVIAAETPTSHMGRGSRRRGAGTRKKS